MILSVILIANVSAWDSYSDWYNNYWVPSFQTNSYNSDYNSNSGGSNLINLNSNSNVNYYSDSVSYQRQTVTSNRTSYISTSVSYSNQTVREEVVSPQKINHYQSDNYNNNYDYNNYNHNSNYNSKNSNAVVPDIYVYDSNHNQIYGSDNCNGVPCSDWRYNPQNYQNGPIYDSSLGYFNWRY